MISGRPRPPGWHALAVRVAELWRYPVKSLQGEVVDAVPVGDHGLEGDRQWALADLETGLALTAKREPRLLLAFARLVAPGQVSITLPDGTSTASDEALSSWLGHPVALRRAIEAERATYEIAADFEAEDTSPVLHWQGPKGSFHDSNRVRVSLVSIPRLGTWDRRRFRMNVVLDSGGEDELIGAKIRVGPVTLEVIKAVDRCVMTTRPQPGGIDRDLDVLRTINRDQGGLLGIGAMVIEGGVLSVGDELTRVA